MATIRSRSDGKLYFDFQHKGQRCREYTKLNDTVINRKKMDKVLKQITALIDLNQLNYGDFFPNSKLVEKFEQQKQNQRVLAGETTPLFQNFVEEWYEELVFSWRNSYARAIRQKLDKRILEYFKDIEVGDITKADVLKFRANLAKVQHENGKKLTAEYINKHINIVKMIMNEATDRFNFKTSISNIKALKKTRTKVKPFSFEEVDLIINSVRKDFQNYYICRFLTGLRTSEIDGLKWKYIDFHKKKIFVHEAFVQGSTVDTKTDGSFREIEISDVVFDSLERQKNVTFHKSEYVFCNTKGGPLDNKNVSARIWHPLLRFLNLESRRPYQTRHTAATLWLASGENPEWIARQMGHTTTEMLFRIYSVFIPNATREDGSAFEKLVNNRINIQRGNK